MYKFISVLIIILSIVYLYYIPEDKLPQIYQLPDPPTIELNKRLHSADKLFQDVLHGPEAIIHVNGFLYTGTIDGRIMKISLEKYETSTLAILGGQNCEKYINTSVCGRPLGIKYHPDGYLVVADAYLGIFKVQINDGSVQLIVPSSLKVNDQRMNFLDDVAVATDGSIYFTDSSVYPLHHLIHDVLDSKPYGRLLKYDADSGVTSVILKDLYFPNGVHLSHYEDFLLFSESTRARILKFHLKGSKLGQVEIFADNLPGLPDNIKSSTLGGYWVAMPYIRHANNQINLIDLLGPYTWIRHLLKMLPMETILDQLPSGSMLLRLNEEGLPVDALIDPDGSHITHVSDILQLNNHLYIGSYKQSYIARIPYST